MGGELVNSAPQISYAEQFKNHFPFYLSIGMTYDQYWNEDCELPKFYREAYELKRSQENQGFWLQGMYIYEALCNVSPVLHAFAKQGTRPNPYPERPYAVSRQEIKAREKEKEIANRRKAKAVFAAWAASLNLADEGVKEDA